MGSQMTAELTILQGESESDALAVPGWAKPVLRWVIVKSNTWTPATLVVQAGATANGPWFTLYGDTDEKAIVIGRRGWRPLEPPVKLYPLITHIRFLSGTDATPVPQLGAARTLIVLLEEEKT